MRKNNTNFSISGIAFRNIRKQKFQTSIVIILLFITTVTLFLSNYLTKSMEEGLKEAKKRLGADLIVVPDRFVSSIEDALFLGKPCTVNFDKGWLRKIAALDGVGQVSYQLYISSLSLDCCDSSVQLIALNMDTDFVVAPWLSKDGITTIGKDEIIIGRNINKKVGDTVTYYGRKFKVIDVLKETGMGYDSSLFISYKTAYDIANDSRYDSILPFQKNKEVISMVLVDVKDNQSITSMKEAIINQYGEEGIAVYTTSDLVSRFAKNLSNFSIYGRMFKTLSLAFSIIALYGIYSITIHLRKAEFGTYLSFGTRKRTIVSILIMEMVIVDFISTFIGIGFVCLFVIPFHTMLKEVLQIPYLMPNGKELLSMGVVSFLINSMVCLLASIKSFYELVKLEGIFLIKANNE